MAPAQNFRLLALPTELRYNIHDQVYAAPSHNEGTIHEGTLRTHKQRIASLRDAAAFTEATSCATLDHEETARRFERAKKDYWDENPLCITIFNATISYEAPKYQYRHIIGLETLLGPREIWIDLIGRNQAVEFYVPVDKDGQVTWESNCSTINPEEARIEHPRNMRQLESMWSHAVQKDGRLDVERCLDAVCAVFKVERWSEADLE